MQNVGSSFLYTLWTKAFGPNITNHTTRALTFSLQSYKATVQSDVTRVEDQYSRFGSRCLAVVAVRTPKHAGSGSASRLR
jgi:hypothetical protein